MGWKMWHGPSAGAVAATIILSAAGSTGGIWGKAAELPGIATLNQGRADIASISCSSAGNCSAGGFYSDGQSDRFPFVASEVGGAWGKAIAVPGILQLNKADDSEVNAVSCGSAGNCSAVGFYSDGTGSQQAFVVDQVNGAWQQAVQFPGTATLSAGHSTSALSVSCRSGGNCSAGGFYLDGSSKQEPFVATEADGDWGDAQQVPGIDTINPADGGTIESVSCSAAGACSAGGAVSDSSGQQVFVVSQVQGVWGTAELIPGSEKLNAGGLAAVNSVSCAAPGDCSAGGSYHDSSGRSQAYVAGEVSGTWGTAHELPGSGTLNGGGNAAVESVSCTTPGNCSAGGSYAAGPVEFQALVASEVNGVWGDAREVPGSGALNAGGIGTIEAVSCTTPGNCAAVGDYHDGSRQAQSLVVGEVQGVWQSAIETPGTATLNAGGGADTEAVSCVAPGNCEAGGSYTDAQGLNQAFVVSQLSSTTTTLTLSSSAVVFGKRQADHITATLAPASATGTVAISSLSASGKHVMLCKITLSAGTGSCFPSATALDAGTYKLTGTYNGSLAMHGSVSPARTLTITKATSTTALRLSKATVAHKGETAEKLSVSVRGHFTGGPAGGVTITATPAKGKAKVICTITLSAGAGSCHLKASSLAVGTYEVTASYLGNADFLSSTSAKKRLKITR